MVGVDLSELAFALAVFFSVVRILTVIAGIWYQSHVTWDRWREKHDNCQGPEAPELECESSSWHFERGVILLTVHLLLAVLTAIALIIRARMPRELVLDVESLLARAASDAIFTVVVALLALVSYRAHIHLRRQDGMLRKRMERLRELELRVVPPVTIEIKPQEPNVG